MTDQAVQELLQWKNHADKRLEMLTDMLDIIVLSNTTTDLAVKRLNDEVSHLAKKVEGLHHHGTASSALGLAPQTPTWPAW